MATYNSGELAGFTHTALVIRANKIDLVVDQDKVQLLSDIGHQWTHATWSQASEVFNNRSDNPIDTKLSFAEFEVTLLNRQPVGAPKELRFKGAKVVLNIYRETVLALINQYNVGFLEDTDLRTIFISELKLHLTKINDFIFQQSIVNPKKVIELYQDC